ncbi:MAG: cytochrome P450 [Acidobacteriota bacterium]
MPASQPPTLRGKPVVGNLREFRRDPLNFLTRIARRHGDVVLFYLGPRRIYLVNHPDYIRDVLVTHSRNFIKSRGLQMAKRFLGEGLLTSEGDAHLRQRRLAQPAFHRQRINAYAQAMVACSARTSDRWRDGETLDIAQEMMRLTLAIVGKTLFDADVESEAKEIGAALTSIMQLFDRITKPFPEILNRLPLPSNFRFRRASRRLDETIYRIINERRRSGEDRGDLLSMLLVATDTEGDGTGMTDRQLRDEAMTIFLAGHETTANALSWTWYLLSQHPEVEARLHTEIDEVLQGRLPEADDFARLKYTEMVLAESMRLYPPAWAMGRQVIDDYKIDSYTIPSGTIILMSPYVMHRDERYYTEPFRFDPERWTEEARQARPRFSYFPFGGGPRVCIGEQFAWMEGVLVLAMLAQRWRMRLAPDQDVKPRPLITLRPKGGIQMKTERRESSVKIPEPVITQVALNQSNNPLM